MATKKRPVKIVTRYVDEQEEETPKAIFDDDPAEESFSQFRSKFGTEGVVVKIYRRTPRGVQYCFHGPPSEIDEEVVRLYHSKQSYASEEGQYSARCFVNGEARDSFPILIAPQLGVVQDNGGMAFGGGQSEIVRLLMAQNERLEMRLNSTQQDREPLSSLADAMVKLQSLQPKSELPIDALIKAVELGRTLSGNDGGGGSEWAPLIKDVLTQAGPVIGQLLGGLTARTQQPPRAVTAGEEPMNEQATEQQMELMLRQAIGVLKRKCLGGSDPGLYIELILDNSDDPIYQRLIHTITNQPFSAFVQIDNEIGTGVYEAFFTAIYNGIRNAFSGSNEVAMDSNKQSGNPKDTKSNGGSGKKSKPGA